MTENKRQNNLRGCGVEEYISTLAFSNKGVAESLDTEVDKKKTRQKLAYFHILARGHVVRSTTFDHICLEKARYKFLIIIIISPSVVTLKPIFKFFCNKRSFCQTQMLKKARCRELQIFSNR